MANSFAQDTFRRADGTLTTPWTAHPSAAGAALIYSNKVRASTTTTVLHYLNNVAAFLNGTISAKVTYVSGSGYTCGVVGRVHDTATTFYTVRLNNSGAIELVKFVAGTSTVLGTFTVNMNPGQTLRVGLRMNGSTIEALRNGVAVISVTDTSIAVAGRCGIRMTGGSATNAGLHLWAFSATDSVVSPPPMPTAPGNNMAVLQREDFDQDFERGDIDTVKTGSDQGLLDPATYGGSLYSTSWKAKATGPIPNEVNVDYDVKKTTWVQDGVLICEMYWDADGRAKGGAVKPIPYPDGIAQTYGTWEYCYRFLDSGSNAVGFGTVFDMISHLQASDPLSWANGSGEYGFPENGHGTTGPLGAYIRDSDGLPNPNRTGHVIRRDFNGNVTVNATPSTTNDSRAFPGVVAPNGMNDYHIAKVIRIPGRTTLIADGVTIWDDTIHPVYSPLGFLMQNGKPGNPAVDAKAQIEIAWIAIDSYTGSLTPPITSNTLVQRIASLITAIGADIKSIYNTLATTQKIVYWDKDARTWGTRGSGKYWTWRSTDDQTATAPPNGAGQQLGDIWQRWKP